MCLHARGLSRPCSGLRKRGRNSDEAGLWVRGRPLCESLTFELWRQRGILHRETRALLTKTKRSDVGARNAEPSPPSYVTCVAPLVAQRCQAMATRRRVLTRAFAGANNSHASDADRPDDKDADRSLPAIAYELEAAWLSIAGMTSRINQLSRTWHNTSCLTIAAITGATIS